MYNTLAYVMVGTQFQTGYMKYYLFNNLVNGKPSGGSVVIPYPL